MQPETAQSGVCGKSSLCHSLKLYLNNKNRLQPIIGLGCVTECVTAGAREAVYVCEVCVCRLTKDDMKNHIMGSLHRYNYIRVQHPHFVSDWKRNVDLAKLARPLMEMAQILERREGTGDVQVLILDAATYEEMKFHSESHALSLLQAIIIGQGPTELESPVDSQAERLPAQPQRVVIPPQKGTGHPKKTGVQSQRSTVLSDNCSDPKQNPFQWNSSPSETTSGDLRTATVQSKISTDDLCGYTGTKPLIGLSCVVECKSEKQGPPQCFLCQCCDVKATNDDIIDHLTNPSHNFNYMIKYNADHLEGMKAGPNGVNHHLQSAASKLEREEGRGKVQVMRFSSSLCSQMAVNSYQWCVSMLKYGFNEIAESGTEEERRDTPETGHNATKVEIPVSLKRHSSALPRQHDSARCQTAPKIHRAEEQGPETVEGKRGEPVFKVSLSLTDGPLLLERMSFSQDPSPLPSSPDSLHGPITSSTARAETVTEMDSGPTLPSSGQHGNTDLQHAPLRSAPSQHPLVYTEDQDTLTDSSRVRKEGRANNNNYVRYCEETQETLSSDRPRRFTDRRPVWTEVERTVTIPHWDDRRGESVSVWVQAGGGGEKRTIRCRFHMRDGPTDNQRDARLTDSRHHSRERYTDNPQHSRHWTPDSWSNSGQRLTGCFNHEVELSRNHQYYTGERQTDSLFIEEEEQYRSETQSGAGLMVEVMRNNKAERYTDSSHSNPSTQYNISTPNNPHSRYNPSNQFYQDQALQQHHTLPLDYIDHHRDVTGLHQHDMALHLGQPQGFRTQPGPWVEEMPVYTNPQGRMNPGSFGSSFGNYQPGPEAVHVDPHLGAPYLGHPPAASPWDAPGLSDNSHTQLVNRLF